ncbi:monovalent cation/H+ antiporter subunit A [Cellvibrio japonicus]|uniref:NADH dehydrogenase subunit 5 n=1 Tax=Cellvibrio japonicus (strain Ueda107) TaxID=498211 RepID=B3PFD0_CELJU|nr:monovalent cation/H+ antiporter subunit A [Cellvibrio japonicus]ACE84788.1 NADH dehydrogenase subunit 5 [Cellvibrio japonicus Ueda107]QEI10803.1 monovalent cation/H+ antiporter subunit A [Cellvibrio japonicus]QEI14379.1 monovalent cation/H+ antiporter subunit A [Cellvibrio japonicus]QEI17957.1 monovalent cation/H+ antiporter subunit A [Cellvibrio japonicus]
MTLLLIIALPLLGAILPLLTERYGRSLCAIAAALGPLLALVLLLGKVPALFERQVFFFHQPWLPQLGLDLSLRLDGLGMIFALLILGIGLLVILYARYYLAKEDSLGRLYAFLLLFMMAMLGIVLSDNLLLLIVFWELTSLSSFLLISFWSHRSEARKGARMALAITGAGGLTLLAGALILGQITGSYSLQVILQSAEQIQAHALYPLALCLILIGAFTKSAQFPFHFWLPHAMAAPTPVSAYLHSATMVKAGVFLLARLYPALSGSDWWFYLVTFVGLATLVFGAYTALFKHDLKGLLAYSTISHLGLITMLFGFSSQLATVAALFHIINHATFKASLFMAAGIIDHETGTRDMRRINGMWRYMPVTATVAMVSASAMAGVPLLNGFLSKEMFFTETLQVELMGGFDWMIPLLATFAGIFAVAYSYRFIHDVFFNGEPINLPIYPPHEAPGYMILPMAVLGLLCLLVGTLPNVTVAPFLEAASFAVLGSGIPEYHIAIWHGVNLPLLMSVVALLGGLWLYSQRKGLFAFYERKYYLDEKMVFEKRIQWIVRQAQRLSDVLDNGSLQRSVALFIGTALLVAAVEFWPLGQLVGQVALSPVDWVSVLLALVLVIAALATVIMHHNRFAALLVMGVVGLVVSLVFVRFSAPDLALTQISVEVVTIILMMLALYFLPQLTPNESNKGRVVRDLLLAVGAALGVGLFTLAILTRPYDTGLADFFLANSVSGGGGTNVVNVILVDFRGFDTLGEITVLAIAGIGVYLMLDGLQLPLPGTDGEGRRWARDPYPPILVVLSRILLPLALMVSAYIFLRGHNQPGGGFIAGLITSVALILQYVCSGSDWVSQRLPLEYRRLSVLGVLIAAVTGLASWVFGYPFLTSTFTHVHWPLVGEFELASAMAFDTGVYITVVGATLLMLAQLGRLAQTTYNRPGSGTDTTTGEVH